MRLARDLEDAVSANELRLAFQPIADAVSLEVVAYEALLRWRHPILGDIPPDVFVPIAESSGLIGSIGSWMMDQAASDRLDLGSEVVAGGEPVAHTVSLRGPRG